MSEAGLKNYRIDDSSQARVGFSSDATAKEVSRFLWSPTMTAPLDPFQEVFYIISRNVSIES